MKPVTLLAAILLAQALPYPNPRDQNCAPGYRSSGGYCAPIDERSSIGARHCEPWPGAMSIGLDLQLT
jgi:hypothetical protein